MENSRPAYSVVIPAFNASSTIGRAIASAQQQTWSPEVIIVVDDCSTDETASIAELMGAKVVSNQRNLGSGRSRNSGLAFVSTPYTALLDADDAWDANFAEIVLGTLVREGADMVGCLLRPELPEQAKALTAKTLLEAQKSSTKRLEIADLCLGSPISNSGTVIRTDFINAIGGWKSPSFCEDYELVVDAYLAGGRILKIPKRLGVYGISPNQKSGQIHNQIQGQLRVFQKLSSSKPYRDTFDLQAIDRQKFKIQLSYLARLANAKSTTVPEISMSFETFRYRLLSQAVSALLTKYPVWPIVGKAWRFVVETRLRSAQTNSLDN